MKTIIALLLTTVGLMAQGTIGINYTYNARVENGLRWLHDGEIARLTALNKEIALTNGAPLPIPNLSQFVQSNGSNAIHHAFTSYTQQAEADAAAKLAQRQKYEQLLRLLREADDAKRDSILDAAIAVANQ